MVKKREEDIRRIEQKIKVNEADMVKLKELTFLHDMKKVGRYVREAALNPSAFCNCTKRSSGHDDFGTPHKIEINRTTAKLKKIGEIVLKDVDKNRSIQLSERNEDSGFKLEGKKFVLIFRNK